jgi:RES domain-containing protein
VIVTAWRMFRPVHARSAFTGEGARLYGGRWNSPGVPMIYSSQSLALAALEMLVHLQSPQVLRKYLACSVTFDSEFIDRIPLRDLPRNWRRNPAPAALRQIGDEWIASQRSLGLEVPSVVVPDESNYLFNPRLPQFTKLRIGKPKPFKFDPRLLRRSDE